MKRTFLKSKLHRATITDSDLSYEGSISIDKNLCKSAGLLPFERVEIYNCNNPTPYFAPVFFSSASLLLYYYLVHSFVFIPLLQE